MAEELGSNGGSEATLKLALVKVATIVRAAGTKADVCGATRP